MPCPRTGAISSSSPTRPTAASTTSSTASPATCATPCRRLASRGRTRDASTRAVFGDYISIYDIARAVEDGATVPIYYESRLAKLELSEAKRPTRAGLMRDDGHTARVRRSMLLASGDSTP